MSRKEEIPILRKAEEFLQLFRKGEEFTKSLLKENERLRYRVAELEEELSQSSNESRLKNYQERIRVLEEELASLKARFAEVEEENKDFAKRYIEVEEENNNLANLYVASYQLHSTLDYEEVLKIVLEIIINLIGAEAFAIFVLDDRHNKLVPVAAEGVDKAKIPEVAVGEGLIGEVATSGEGYFGESMVHTEDFDLNKPIVCIPLKIKEHTIGVIAFYSFLIQKSSFSNIDYELFNLLAGHAATAIFSSKLYTQSERKLSTIQGFLELLKSKPSS
ncbi:MAG: GAF domain-containing protein [Nitrospirae bacterium]|nr:MAG: GAF domain-containing protein [Nitrospirota bacterium]